MMCTAKISYLIWRGVPGNYSFHNRVNRTDECLITITSILGNEMSRILTSHYLNTESSLYSFQTKQYDAIFSSNITYDI